MGRKTGFYITYSVWTSSGDDNIFRVYGNLTYEPWKYTIYNLVAAFVLRRICPRIMIPTRWRLLLGANEVDKYVSE